MSPPRPLHWRVLFDALASRMDIEAAEDALDRVLADAGPPSSLEPGGVLAYLRGPARSSLIDALGVAEAHEVLVAAGALTESLRADAFRRVPVAHARLRASGPFVVLGDRPSAFDRIVDLRRVVSVFDALDELEHAPSAVFVVDAWAALVAPETLVLVASEIPSTVRIVVVGASDAFRARVESECRRHVTFTDAYEPCGMVRRTLEPRLAAAARRGAETEPVRGAA